MTIGPNAPLRDSLLDSIGVAHGFGQRGTEAPPGCVFPHQVHGIEVFEATGPNDAKAAAVEDADAIVARSAGVSVGVVTADCVPILVATRGGQSVAAIHAGWRGLAAGVIEAGISALVGGAARECVAAIGPAARGCCYEVDEPVRAGLAERYFPLLDGVLAPGRADHYQLDLPVLAERVLLQIGVESTRIGVEARLCTICGGERFESYRREGADAGRLRHFITGPEAIPRQG